MKRTLATLLSLAMILCGMVYCNVGANGDVEITTLATPVTQIRGITETSGFPAPTPTASATNIEEVSLSPTWNAVNFTFGESLIGRGQQLLEYTATYTAPDGYVFSDALSQTENTSLSADKKQLVYTLYTYVIPRDAVYIDDSGSDSASDYAEGNYEKPYKTLKKAVETLNGSGVIVIKNQITTTYNAIGEGARGTYVIMGWDDSSTLSVSQSARFFMDTVLRDLNINYNTTKYIGIYAHGKNFVLGDENYTDLKITSSDGVTRQFMATGDGGSFSGANVTINSGEFDSVYASGYGRTTMNGDIRWTINGGKFKNFTAGFHCGNSSVTHTLNGNIYVTINGGEFTSQVSLGHVGSNSSTKGDVFTVINGGTFRSNIVGMTNIQAPFDGNMRLDINGGTFLGSANSIKLGHCAGSEASSYTVVYTEYDGDKTALNAKIDKNYVSEVIGNIYYVDSANGDDSNDGLTHATALATITKAFSKFSAKTGGKIFICGDYSPATSNFIDTVNRGTVTISGYDENARILIDKSIDFKSDAIIENIKIHSIVSYLSVRAVNCKLVFGDGLICTNEQGISRLQPAGTGYSGNFSKIDITINSGEYGLTYGGELGGAKVTGDINWTINGGNFMRSSILLASYCSTPKSLDSDTSVTGNVNLTVNGGTINQPIKLHNGYAPIKGDVNVVINGGNITNEIALGVEQTNPFTLTVGEVDYIYNPGVEGNIYVEINGGSVSGAIKTKNRITGKKILIANNGIVPPAVSENTFDYCIYNQPNGTVKAIIDEETNEVSFSIVPNSSALPILVDGVEIQKNDQGIYTLSPGVHTISYDKAVALSATLIVTPPMYGIAPITKVVNAGGKNTYNAIGNCSASDITWTPNDTLFKYNTPYTATLTLTSEGNGLTFLETGIENGVNINNQNMGNTYKSFDVSLNDTMDVATLNIHFDAIPTPTPENTKQKISGKFITKRNGTSSSKFHPTTVTLENKLDGSKTTITATENKTNGSYAFNSVPIGTYKLTIRKSGYLPYIYDNLDVYSGRNLELDADLLIDGDIDASGEIDIDDFIIYLRAFANNCDESVLNAIDIYEDGSIASVEGLAVVKAGLNTTSAESATINENSRTMAFANTHYKLTVEKKLNIGFIGGSITANAGNKYYGYDEQFYDMMCREFPDADINYVQAGIGNTGSNFGIFRLESQLMRKTANMPDLVFLEYAVNDFGTFGNEHIEMLMESLILNVYRINPNADIAIILTALSGYEPSRNAHIKVAEHYGIPVIDVGRPSGALNTAVGDCKITTNDNLHPNTPGYELYNKILTERILPYLKGSKAPSTASFETRTLPAPMKTNLITNPKFISPSDDLVVKTGSWSTVSKDTITTLSGCHVISGTTGDTMTFTFNGSSCGIVFLKGEDIGVTEYKLDDGEWKLFNPCHSQIYTHYQTYYFEDNLEAGPHTLTVRVSGYAPNGKACPVASELTSSTKACKVGIACFLYNETN